MKTFRYQLKLQRCLCSFILQYEDIETCHIPEYVVHQKQPTNSDKKHKISITLCKKTVSEP